MYTSVEIKMSMSMSMSMSCVARGALTNTCGEWKPKTVKWQ